MRKLIAALLVAGILFGVGAVAVDAQSTWQVFENVRVKGLQVLGDATVGDDLTVTDDLSAADLSAATLTTSGAATIGGNATISGTSNLVGNTTVAGTFAANGDSLTVAKTLNLARQGAIAVTSGSTITPTGTFQELTAAGAVGASVAAPAAAGRLVILFNSTTNAITITDTTGINLSADWVGAQNDSLTLLSTAAGQWMEVARSNN